MSSYTIKDLERLSSQKAHTIRIWEQRYGLLQPERTDTNIRYYNDDQLKKLLNVTILIEKGMKISHISRLSKQEMDAEIQKVIDGFYEEDAQIEGLIGQALFAISTYDEILFNEMFSVAIDTLGLENTYTKIIYPLLVRTGLMWINDTLLPSQEHFLSNLIRQKLFAAIDALPRQPVADQTWVLFLNENEDHEIGLLFANYLLRSHGKKVIYLGARVPYQDLVNVVQQSKPTHIYTFFIAKQSEDYLTNLVNSLLSDFEYTRLCISGGDEKLARSITAQPVKQVNSIESLIKLIRSNE